VAALKSKVFLDLEIVQHFFQEVAHFLGQIVAALAASRPLQASDSKPCLSTQSLRRTEIGKRADHRNLSGRRSRK
jgi:hypothetical protein